MGYSAVVSTLLRVQGQKLNKFTSSLSFQGRPQSVKTLAARCYAMDVVSHCQNWKQGLTASVPRPSVMCALVTSMTNAQLLLESVSCIVSK